MGIAGLCAMIGGGVIPVMVVDGIPAANLVKVEF
jgi:hypothetical protein